VRIEKAHTVCQPCIKFALKTLYRWFKTEVVGEIIWSIKCKLLFFSDSPPFPRDDVFTLMSIFIIVIVWRGLSAECSWRYRKLKRSCQTRTVVPVTNRYDGSPPHKQKSSLIKIKYSKLTIEKSYEGQYLLSFFHCKQVNQLTCCVKTNCFHFVKIDNRNNKSDVNIKNLITWNRWRIWKTLYLHCLLQVTSPTTLLSIVLKLWITLYNAS
jgi:hypothetical protein